MYNGKPVYNEIKLSMVNEANLQCCSFKLCYNIIVILSITRVFWWGNIHIREDLLFPLHIFPYKSEVISVILSAKILKRKISNDQSDKVHKFIGWPQGRPGTSIIIDFLLNLHVLAKIAFILQPLYLRKDKNNKD